MNRTAQRPPKRAGAAQGGRERRKAVLAARAPSARSTSWTGLVDLSGDARGERRLRCCGLGRGDLAGREGSIELRVAVGDQGGDQTVTGLARGDRDLGQGLARLLLGAEVGLGRADVSRRCRFLVDVDAESARATGSTAAKGKARARLVDGGRDLLGGVCGERGAETVARLAVSDGDVGRALTGLWRGAQLSLGDADVRRGGREDVAGAERSVGREDCDAARQL